MVNPERSVFGTDMARLFYGSPHGPRVCLTGFAWGQNPGLTHLGNVPASGGLGCTRALHRQSLPGFSIRIIHKLY
jgi:hypothetical protein